MSTARGLALAAALLVTACDSTPASPEPAGVAHDDVVRIVNLNAAMGFMNSQATPGAPTR